MWENAEKADSVFRLKVTFVTELIPESLGTVTAQIQDETHQYKKQPRDFPFSQRTANFLFIPSKLETYCIQNTYV